MKNEFQKFSVFIILISTSQMVAQGGCTDPLATNYNASATYNNGSCTYASTSFSLTNATTLPAALNEISGMVYHNEKLYAHQDSGGPATLYEIDITTSAITKNIILSGATNVDWEDMAQDEAHFYIADSGNNVNGNRTDLKIYKFPKSAIGSGSSVVIPEASIEVINFSYEDQTNFAPTGVNNTRFDCEAIAYNRGVLHLFTKNWIGSHSVHYTIPTEAGTHIAQRRDSIFTNDIKITGADFGAWDELILIGYRVTGTGNGALFLIYGFDGSYNYFNTGCRRRLNMSSAASNGQVEGICFANALEGFASNEAFTYTIPIFGTFTVPQRYYRFNIFSYIKDYYERNQPQFTPYPPVQGMIRYNSSTAKTEGYDGTHWVNLSNN